MISFYLYENGSKFYSIAQDNTSDRFTVFYGPRAYDQWTRTTTYPAVEFDNVCNTRRKHGYKLSKSLALDTDKYNKTLISVKLLDSLWRNGLGKLTTADVRELQGMCKWFYMYGELTQRQMQLANQLYTKGKD